MVTIPERWKELLVYAGGHETGECNTRTGKCAVRGMPQRRGCPSVAEEVVQRDIGSDVGRGNG